MSSQVLGAFVNFDKQVILDVPQAVHKTSEPAPLLYELDDLSWGARYNGPGPSGTTRVVSGTHTGFTSNEIERSRPASPEPADAAHLVQSWSSPPMNKWRVLSACLVYFANALNDSAPGPLIPYIEPHYHIGYAIVSLIFVTNAVGFLLAGFLTDVVDSRLGRAKALVFAELMVLIGFVMIICTPPFAVVVVAFLFIGYGEGTNLALNNVFCANLAQSSIILGAAHGSYGIGGVVGPLIATALASHGVLWSRFYIIPAGVVILALFCSGWAFWNYEKEASPQLLTTLERTASHQAAGEMIQHPKIQLLKRAMKNRTTLVGGLFIFAYQGAEVAISGWVVSFLITYRGGNPAEVGYVTAGFWGGITLGRFTLVHAAPRLGEKAFVYGLTAATIAFQILVWLVPNIIGNAVAVSIVGLLLGPVYPCAMTVFTRLLPRQMQMTAIGLISSMGSSGGAIAPFTVGILAQAVGTWVLNPVCIALYVAMEFSWFALPRGRKRME